MQHTVRIFGPNFAFGLIYLVLRDPQSSTSSQCPTSSNHKFTSPDMIIIQVIYVIFIWYLYDFYMILIRYWYSYDIYMIFILCLYDIYMIFIWYSYDLYFICATHIHPPDPPCLHRPWWQPHHLPPSIEDPPKKSAALGSKCDGIFTSNWRSMQCEAPQL